MVRWEVQTGSAITFVWSRNMSQFVDVGEYALGQDLRRLFGANAEDIFLIKASYLLNI